MLSNHENYQIVQPKDFTPEQKSAFQQRKLFIQEFSSQNLPLSLIDVTSTVAMFNNNSAQLVGLKHGGDAEGMRAKDYPCEGVAQFADRIEANNKLFLANPQPHSTQKTLSIMSYATGLDARIGSREFFCHHESKSILGIFCYSTPVEMKSMFALIPNYLQYFGAAGSSVIGSFKFNNISLTEYEQEICYLLVFGWTTSAIANFMNEHRPLTQRSLGQNRDEGTINKKIESVRHKFGLASIKDLKLCLFENNFHLTLPKSFYQKQVGSAVLSSSH